MPMEQWLEMREVNEISLVPDASNPLADVAFVKAAKKPAAPAEESIAKLSAVLGEASARAGAEAGIAKISAGYGALATALDAIGGEAGLTAVHKSKIIAALGNFEAVLADLVPTVVVSKAVAESMMAITGTEGGTIVKEKAMELAEVQKALTDSEAKLSTALATIEKMKADNVKLQGDLDVAKAALPGAKDEDIYKGLPESIVNIMKADRASIAESKALIQKMGDDAEGAALATVLKAAAVPDFDTVAPALLRIEKGRPLAARKVGDKDVAADVEIVKAALLAKSATARAPLTVVGSGAREDIIAKVGETDAEAKLKAAAVTIQKAAKDGGKKVTYEMAFTQAMDENPALYGAYQKERAAR